MATDGGLLCPELTLTDLAALYEKVTGGDRPRALQLHASNVRSEISFDEFVELLVRAAVASRGRGVHTPLRPSARGDAHAALREIVDSYLQEFYVATAKFAPGRLLQYARRIGVCGTPAGADALSEAPERRQAAAACRLQSVARGRKERQRTAERLPALAAQRQRATEKRRGTTAGAAARGAGGATPGKRRGTVRAAGSPPGAAAPGSAAARRRRSTHRS